MHKKNAYRNARPERLKFVDSLPFEITKDYSAENAGKNGFNLQEMAVDIDGVMPNDIYDNGIDEKEYNLYDTLDRLKRLKEEINEDLSEDELTQYVDFIDIIIEKIAYEESEDYLKKFNDLLIKVNNADIADTNDAIKKLAKIFSRTVLLAMSNGADKNAAYKSAYLKILNRANQYLSSDKMIKTADPYQNPLIVAEKIKQIIDVLVSRFSTDARIRSYPNIKSKILKLNPVEIANKKSPGGAAIGVSITLIKNILNGRDPYFIHSVINNLARIL